MLRQLNETLYDYEEYYVDSYNTMSLKELQKKVEDILSTDLDQLTHIPINYQINIKMGIPSSDVEVYKKLDPDVIRSMGRCVKNYKREGEIVVHFSESCAYRDHTGSLLITSFEDLRDVRKELVFIPSFMEEFIVETEHFTYHLNDIEAYIMDEEDIVELNNYIKYNYHDYLAYSNS